MILIKICVGDSNREPIKSRWRAMACLLDSLLFPYSIRTHPSISPRVVKIVFPMSDFLLCFCYGNNIKIEMVNIYVYRIPIWYTAKLVFVAWLVLPQFRGAAFIYNRIVREQFKKYGILKPKVNLIHPFIFPFFV